MLLLFVTFTVVTQFAKPQLKRQRVAPQALPDGVKNFTFNYNDMLATLAWIRVLQDIHICFQNRKGIGPIPDFDNKIDPVAQVLNRELPESRCHLSWVYHMVDVTTELDPTFYSAYYTGGLFLTVAVDDREGASRIFKKGLLYFPERWPLLYAAGYHELFEMKRPKVSAQLLKRAAERGAPPWVYSLSARLYTEVGQAEFAKHFLEEVLSKNLEGDFVDRIRGRLDEINNILEKNKDQAR